MDTGGFELDHVFVFTDPGALVADRISGAGFAEGRTNRHPGQGTANRRFFFAGGMLELLYVTDPAETLAPEIRWTRLYERAGWRSGGACPIGICLRPLAGETRRAPFPFWEYRPPYLPAGSSIPVAQTAGDPRQPFLFVLAPMPSSAPPAGPRDVRAITGLRIQLPYDVEPTLDLVGFAQVSRGLQHRATVEVDHGRQRRRLDLAPDAALRLHW